MTNSVVLDDRHPKLAKRAYGYQIDGDGFALNDDDPLNYIVGSGGIYSTVEDLYRWDQELYRENLVSKTTLAKAFSPTRLNSGEDLSIRLRLAFRRAPRAPAHRTRR